jgi:2-dehydropantoate 2-reductase
VDNGALVERPELRTSLEAAAREAGAVAEALGIRLGADPAALALEAASRTRVNLSSMLQDVERGARTEIEAINGAVAREARRLGVPAPVNEDLCRRVRALESRSDAKGGAA